MLRTTQTKFECMAHDEGRRDDSGRGTKHDFFVRGSVAVCGLVERERELTIRRASKAQSLALI